MFYTTLDRIRKCRPCRGGWEQLLKHLGKTKADDEPLSLLAILESNGLDDAVWALRAIDDCPEIRLFAVRCARQVQHLLADQRSIDALDTAERYTIGEATKGELTVARAATWDTAEGAVDAAWEAWEAAQADVTEAQRQDFIDIFLFAVRVLVSKKPEIKFRAFLIGIGKSKF